MAAMVAVAGLLVPLLLMLMVREVVMLLLLQLLLPPPAGTMRTEPTSAIPSRATGLATREPATFN